MQVHPEKRQEDRIKVTDIFATLNPGGRSARIENVSEYGLALQYITDLDQAEDVEEIIMLVDGVAQTLRADRFKVVYDREIKRAGSNGYRLRKVGIRLKESQFDELCC